MGVEVIFCGHVTGCRDIVAGACARATDTGDDPGGFEAGGDVLGNGGIERGHVHSAGCAGGRDAAQVGLTDAGYPDGPVDGGMHLARTIDAQRIKPGKPVFIALPAERTFAHG